VRCGAFVRENQGKRLENDFTNKHANSTIKMSTRLRKNVRHLDLGISFEKQDMCITFFVSLTRKNGGLPH
jgi:hypothetical protein